MLDAIMQKCSDYYDAIPSDTVPKILKSAIFSFTAAGIYASAPGSMPVGQSNVLRALMASGVAALASLIYSLTVPLFNYAFGDDRILIHREMMKHFIVIDATSVIVDYLMTGKVNMLSVKILGCMASNVFLGCLESVAIMQEWIDPNAANDSREMCKCLGFDSIPGSSSIFITWGSWEWGSLV